MTKQKRKSISELNPIDKMLGLVDEQSAVQAPNSDGVNHEVQQLAPQRKRAKKEKTNPTLFLLNEKHIIWLDKQCNYARQDGGIALNRAMIVRTLLDIAAESRVDLHTIRSEAELKQRLAEAIKK